MEPLPQFHRKLHTCSGNAIHVLFIKKMYQYEYNDWGIALIRLSITFHIYTQLICSPSIYLYAWVTNILMTFDVVYAETIGTSTIPSSSSSFFFIFIKN